MIVRNKEEKLEYIRDITKIITTENDINTVSLDIFPNEFDMHLMYLIRYKQNISLYEIMVYYYII